MRLRIGSRYGSIKPRRSTLEGKDDKCGVEAGREQRGFWAKVQRNSHIVYTCTPESGIWELPDIHGILKVMTIAEFLHFRGSNILVLVEVTRSPTPKEKMH